MAKKKYSDPNEVNDKVKTKSSKKPKKEELPPDMAKCIVTREIGPKSEFFEGPDNKWFKSKEIYLGWKAGRKERSNAIKINPKGRTDGSWNRMKNKAFDAIGYQELKSQYIANGSKGKFTTPSDWNTLIPMNLNTLCEFYCDEDVIDAFDYCEKMIQHAFQTKTFESDKVKISYMFGIIRGNIAYVKHRNDKKRELAALERQQIEARKAQQIQKFSEQSAQTFDEPKIEVKDITAILVDEEDD